MVSLFIVHAYARGGHVKSNVECGYIEAQDMRLNIMISFLFNKIKRNWILTAYTYIYI